MNARQPQSESNRKSPTNQPLTRKNKRLLRATPETWRKKFKPCSVCDRQAEGCYSPDMDIHGLCFCADHKLIVIAAYMELINNGITPYFKKLTKGWKHVQN